MSIVERRATNPVPPVRPSRIADRRLAERANRELEDASAAAILTWAAETFGPKLVVTSALADTVMIHLAEQALPGVDVVFLDTGYHFPETLGTRDAVQAVHNVRLLSITPAQTVAEQDAAYGPDLFARDPDRCCALRKVQPLNRVLQGYEAWASGVRRADSPARATTPVVSWDARRELVKIAPIARWTDADVEAYVTEHGLMVNPLVFDGYPSIGCAPCTLRPVDGNDTRSGRWAGLAKTECGIHL